MLEIVLIVAMVSLSLVLFLEMREYRKIIRLTTHLESIVNTYTAAFNSITAVLTALETRCNIITKETSDMRDEIKIVKTILDVHNKVLSLDPDLLSIGNGKPESEI